MKKLFSILLVLMLLTGCAAPAVQSGTEIALAEIAQLGTSPDDNYRTWYEIFVYSFCDSDGDGIGDLKGVLSKLDYLEELGVNGIWFMPLHPSQSYHKYDVSDYFQIDPAYGTLEDFRDLLAACKERDIHVIMDLVLNHTADNHPWFQEACDYLRSLPAGEEPKANVCPYVNYYYFTREPAVNCHPISGSDWYYEGNFSPNMPDLNLGYGPVRREIDAIMSYWLGMGVDGFRLDAAKEFYSGNTPKNLEVLSWIQETAASYKEDVYLVAEVWDGFGAVTEYYKSGITSLFDFPFGSSGGKIVTILRNAGNDTQIPTYAEALEKADTAYAGANPAYIDAPFLSNHDVGRIAGFVSRDENKTKLAGAMNLFMSGSAFIYYGEEIGMLGGDNDPSKRAPMYWNVARDKGTTAPPPDCRLPEEYPFGSLEEQQEDDLSVYNYYRRAVAIRQALPVISHGKTTAEKPLNFGCISAFRKTWGEEECIILVNISDINTEVDLEKYVAEGWTLAASLSVGEEMVRFLEEGYLMIPGYGAAVLLPA